MIKYIGKIILYKIVFRRQNLIKIHKITMSIIMIINKIMNQIIKIY